MKRCGACAGSVARCLCFRACDSQAAVRVTLAKPRSIRGTISLGIRTRYMGRSMFGRSSRFYLRSQPNGVKLTSRHRNIAMVGGLMSALPQLRTITEKDGAAVLDLRRGVISTLNETGSHVWQALVDGDSPESIINRLMNDSGQPREQIEHDVLDFIASLREQELLPS